MRKHTFGIGAAVLAAVVAAAAGVGRAADEKPAKVDVPQKVTDAVMGRFPKAEVTHVEKENENGGVVYDFEIRHDGRKYELDVKEDGTITEIEKAVDAKDVPPAVTKAVEAKYPKAAVSEVMEVNLVNGKEEKPDHYEVTLRTADGKEMEVVVALDGSKVTEEAAEPKPADPKPDPKGGK